MLRASFSTYCSRGKIYSARGVAFHKTYAKNTSINRYNTNLIDWNGNVLDSRQLNSPSTSLSMHGLKDRILWCTDKYF